MKIKYFVPIEVKIKNPDEVLDAFVKHWGEGEIENPNQIHVSDLLLHAGKTGNAVVDIPDYFTQLHCIDWIYQNGHPEDDETYERGTDL